MKVIADAGRDNFIVSATKTELANVCGFSWTGEAPCPIIQVGAVINVTEAYRALAEIRMVNSKIKDIEKCASGLLEVIKLKRNFIEPIVEQALKQTK